MHYQKKKLTRTAVAVLMILSAACVSAQAEEATATKEDTAKTTNTPSPKVVHKLSPITIVEKRESVGEKTIEGQDLQMLPTATGTVTDSLRGMSSVQFDANSRSGLTGGEITPPAISIRGSRHYENAFTINGISNNNNFGGGAWDPSQSSAGTIYDQPLSGDTQSIILTKDILDSVNVKSENISAEYGEFTGGVVDAKVRDARTDRWHAKVGIRHTSDSLTKMHYYPGSTAAGEEMPSQSSGIQKEFKKYSGGIVLDGPINNGALGVLLSYQKDWSSMPVWTPYQAGTSRDPYLYSKERHSQKRNLDNFLLKVHSDQRNDFYAAGTIIYSPYTASLYADNVKDGDYSLDGGGLSFILNTRANLSIGQWSNDLGLSFNNISRDASSNTQYNWRKSASVPWAPEPPAGASASTIANFYKVAEGLTGDYKQRQQTWTFKSKFDFIPLQLKNTIHDIKTGVDVQYVKAKTNIQSYKLFDSPYASSTVKGDRDNGVIEGEQYARALMEAPGLNRSKGYLTLAGFLEDSVSIERFTLRPGVRLSYDDITKDVNVAPRLFANVDILNDHRFNLNAGYNRYYGSQILTYALSARQQKNAYNRSLNSDGTPTEWTYDAKRSQSSEYKNLGDLKTPYSDEYTLGASADVFNHTLFKIQAVKRQYRDQIRVAKTNTKVTDIPIPGYDPYVDAVGSNTLSNDGSTNYKGITLSVEKYFDLGKFGNHHSEIAITRSKLRGNSLNWTSSWTEGLAGGDVNPFYVYIDGQKVSADDINAGNFNADWVITYTQDSSFFNDRLRSSVLFRYESAADRLTNRKVVRGDDSDWYYSYHKDSQKPMFNMDMSLSYDIYKTKESAVTLELQALNVLDRKNQIYTGGSTNYSLGRQFFIGLSASY